MCPRLEALKSESVRGGGQGPVASPGRPESPCRPDPCLAHWVRAAPGAITVSHGDASCPPGLEAFLQFLFPEEPGSDLIYENYKQIVIYGGFPGCQTPYSVLFLHASSCFSLYPMK